MTINAGSFGVTYLNDGANVGSNAIAVDGDCAEIYDDGSLQDRGCIGDDEFASDLGLDEIFFVVSEVDGGYQLDPAATLVEYAETAVDGLTGDVVDRIIEDLQD